MDFSGGGYGNDDSWSGPGNVGSHDNAISGSGGSGGSGLTGISTTTAANGDSVEVRTYSNGTRTTTSLDSTGSGTVVTTTASGSDITYTMSNNSGDIPAVLDLDGDGIERAFGTQAAFDYDGDGFRERTNWVGKDDGFLVIDLNEDGSRGAGDDKIDKAKELTCVY